MANLTGKSIIGFQPGGEGDPAVFGINPATGESLQPGYAAVSETELNRAVELAADAFEVFGKTSGTDKAAFLRKIADNIEAIGDDLARLAPQETGLPEGRIRMETGRTCGQLRLFASVAEEGTWVDARIDLADPERVPVPKPDVRSMAHALKGTGYSLDIDHTKMDEIESLLNEGLSEYEFNPVTTSADARVVGFPMPGGAIGPNVHMMQSAGILDKYSAVLAEFPEVVRAGGGWTSVTPGSQQYWLQAFNNVLHGRWKKIDAGFGKSVLGYFGKPPLSPDPEVAKIAAEQLKLPPFDGDPLEAAPDTLAEAEAALKERGIEITDENKFLVAAAIVPGKNMELNEGIRLLEGRSKITLPLKKEPTVGAATLTAPTKTKVTVNEGGNTRTYEVIIEPPASAAAPALGQAQTGGGQATDVFSPFDGNVELVEVNVKVGDTVTLGQVVAAVEAMKAKHDVKAPCAGRVSAVHAAIGNEVSAGKPILTIEA